MLWIGVKTCSLLVVMKLIEILGSELRDIV